MLFRSRSTYAERCYNSLAAICVFLPGGVDLPYVFQFSRLPFSQYSSNPVLDPVVIVAPFIKPANGVGDTPPLPYYLYAMLFPVFPLSFLTLL